MGTTALRRRPNSGRAAAMKTPIRMAMLNPEI